MVEELTVREKTLMYVSRLKMRVYKLSADQLHLHRAEIIGGKVGVLDSFQYPR